MGVCIPVDLRGPSDRLTKATKPFLEGYDLLQDDVLVVWDGSGWA